MTLNFTSLFCACAVMVSAGCYTTTPSRRAGDARKLDARSHTNDTRFYSEAMDRVVEPGQMTFFDGFFADGQRLEDELDFYAILDEKEKIKGIVEWREKHNRAVQIAWAGVGVGAVAIGAGIGLLAANQDNVEGFIATDLGRVTMGLFGVGGLLVSGGGYAYFAFGPGEVLSGEGDYEPGLKYAWEEALPAISAYNAKQAGQPAAPETPAAP